MAGGFARSFCPSCWTATTGDTQLSDMRDTATGRTQRSGPTTQSLPGMRSRCARSLLLACVPDRLVCRFEPACVYVPMPQLGTVVVEVAALDLTSWRPEHVAIFSRPVRYQWMRVSYPVAFARESFANSMASSNGLMARELQSRGAKAPIGSPAITNRASPAGSGNDETLRPWAQRNTFAAHARGSKAHVICGSADLDCGLEDIPEEAQWHG